MILPATYQNGFAPRDGQPLYPSLWRGCVGAWAPCLGPTGLTLRDWSGFGNHGTLTNLTAANCWQISEGRYSASLASASTNRILCQKPVLSGTGNFTIAAFVNPLSLTGTINEFYIAGNYGVANLTGVEFYGFNGKLGCYVSSGATFFSTATLATGVLSHVAATRLNGTINLYINGVFDSSATRAGSIGTSLDWCIGNGPDYTAGYGGKIDSVFTCDRALSDLEIRRLASRRGIAYEMAPRRRSSVQVTTNRRRRIIIGGNR